LPIPFEPEAVTKLIFLLLISLTLQLTKEDIWKKDTFGKKIHLEKRYIWKKDTFGKKIHLEKRYIWKKDTFGKNYVCSRTM